MSPTLVLVPLGLLAIVFGKPLGRPNAKARDKAGVPYVMGPAADGLVGQRGPRHMVERQAIVPKHGGSRYRRVAVAAGARLEEDSQS